MAKISSADQASMQQINSDLNSVAAQANATADVQSNDPRLTAALDKLHSMESTYSNDPEAAGAIARLIVDIQNLQGIASSTQHSTGLTNTTWKHEMDDVTSLANSLGASGDASAYKGASLGTVVGNPASVGGDLAKAPSTSTVHAMATTPETYVEENPVTSQYSIYDASGKMTSQFDFKDADKFGVALGDGQIAALGQSGFSGSWLINGDGGRTAVGNGAPGSINPHDSSATPAAATPPAAANSATDTSKLSDDAHGVADKAGGKTDDHGWAFWAGSTSSAGTVQSTVTAVHVDGTTANNRHWVKLTNEKGENITPTQDNVGQGKGMDRGQYGNVKMTNGSEYISSSQGYFMVSGGVARNIITGEQVTDAAKVADIVSSGSGNPTYTQADIESANKKNDDAAAQETQLQHMTSH